MLQVYVLLLDNVQVELVLHLYLQLAPSAAPTSVNITSVNSSSITVQWGPVDCIHRNGDITSHLVRYGQQTLSASGDSVTEATLSGLTPSTLYSIEVAAVTSAGTGQFSNVQNAMTTGKMYYEM